jgi:hypothetical protein
MLLVQERFWVILIRSRLSFFLVVSLIYFTFFQEALGVFLQYFGLSFVAKLIPMVKYVIVLIFFSMLSSKIFKDNSFYYIFFLFFIILSFTIILSGGGNGVWGFFGKIIICIFLFFIGKYIRLHDNAGKSLDTLFFWLSGLTIIFGLFDYFYVYMVTDDSLLRIFKVGEYFNISKGDNIVNGLPGNLYGSYSLGWFAIRRLAGIFFVPLTYAYFAVFLLYYQLDHQRWILVILLLVTIALTFTRAILIPLSFILIFHFIKNAYGLVKLFLIPILGIFFLYILAYFYSDIIIAYNKYFMDSSGTIHMSAISNGINFPFVNIDLAEPGLSEGVWWTISKLGWVFIVLLFIMLVPFFKAALKSRFLLYALITYLFTSILSLQLFSPTSVLFFWIILGLVNNKMFKEYRKADRIENRLFIVKDS